MVTSYSRGHKIYLKDNNWYYEDNNQPHDDSRPCKKCNCYPTKEGYDSCTGYIKGATSVCCGHGDYIHTDNFYGDYAFEELLKKWESKLSL